MIKLGAKAQRGLKCFHVVFACMWVGGATSLTLMNFFLHPESGPHLHGILTAMNFIDDFIIIPGAMGLLLTGLIYSVFTRWGWFKHTWITVKWVINVYGVIFGTFWLGPWLNSLAPMASKQGMDCLANPVYIHNVLMLKTLGTLQAATIIFAVIISVIKPWKNPTHSGKQK
jgi:hypothetical protein